ncbi:hypothetical protein AMTRI_Chr05g73180 [Amborella trichopoda]
MAFAPPQFHPECHNDYQPLLMEQSTNLSNQEHVISLSWVPATSSGSSAGPLESDTSQGRPDTRNTRQPNGSASSSSSSSSSRNGSLVRRSGDGYGRRRRSPLNSGLWISIEFTIVLSQIIASIVVLALSRNEKPQAPLFIWVVGYALGCVATLPHLYWRFIHRNNRGSEQEATHMPLSSSQSNASQENASYTAITVSSSHEDQESHTTTATSWIGQDRVPSNPRLGMIMDHFKMALDCFFAVWFVVGNVWIFGGHSSSSDAPNLYRLCIVFLTFSCIGYAMPFILCATICCCLPCIISILGFRDDQSRTRGATTEAINSLPTCKFKAKGVCERNRERENGEIDSEVGEGGVIAAGTDKERIVSAEDAVCCICLAKYEDEEELRELPCSHCFHVECVDTWLKINGSCPLCKHVVGDPGGSGHAPDQAPSRPRIERRSGSGVAASDVYGATLF